jgi:RND family efflux transporter MFP subunit
MKRSFRVYAILIVVLFGTAAGGYWLGSRSGMDQMIHQSAEVQADEAILYWRAPMDPTETYDGPGKSKMGMDLIPVYAEEAKVESVGTVVMSDAVTQQMGVRYGEVHRMDLVRSIRTVGEVKVDEERVFLVNTRISGWVKKLHVAFDGAPVRKGDSLFDIYSPELISTQEEYIRALGYLDSLSDTASQSMVDGAQRLVTAARTRMINWDIPAEFVDHLNHTRTVQQTVTLPSPVTGVVLQKDVVEGGYITKGANVFRIVDLSQVWVHASFYDYELPWISLGQEVEVELSYLPGNVYKGQVSYIYPVLREQARDVHVRIVVPNKDLELKPGMFANVQLAGKTLKNVIVVPTEAIIRSGQRSLVILSAGKGTFEPREVETGGEGGPGNGLAHIISGLEPGERVVTSAQFLIDSESRLQEAIQKMRNSLQEGSRMVPGEVSRMDHSDMVHEEGSESSEAAPVIPMTNMEMLPDSANGDAVAQKHDH